MSQTVLVLASGSPRRKMLLERLGIPLEVDPADLDERTLESEVATDYVTRLAEAKSRAVARRHPESWVIAADTTVVVGEAIFGKPGDVAEAEAMLSRLSGCAHRVLTGVALTHGEKTETKRVETRVQFRALSEAEIRWYARTGEGLDKAGAYAIQGIASAFVEEIHGSHSNVIGLPLSQTVELLARAGLPLPWSGA